MSITSQANTVYRDYVTQGLPLSGKHRPNKREIRQLMALIDITVSQEGFTPPPGWADTLANVLSRLEDLDATEEAVTEAAGALADLATQIGVGETGVVVYEGGEGYSVAPKSDFKGDPGGDAYSVGLFTARAIFTIPPGMDLIQTTGHTRLGVGRAFYSRDPNQADGVESVMRAKWGSPGVWFKIAESELRAEMFGVIADGTAFNVGTDNAPALNAMEEALWTIGVQGPATMVVRFPRGVILFDDTVVKRGFVNWYGAGRNATIFRFRNAASVAMDCAAAGTGLDDRRQFSIQDMRFEGVGENTSTGFSFGLNIRAFELLSRVAVFGFGGPGIYFAKTCFDINFHGVEVINCATNVENGGGVQRDASITDMAAIRFYSCAIEGCGSNSSTGGGVLWGGTENTQGLWFHDLRIQGNHGAAEAYFERCQPLTFSDAYLETENDKGSGHPPAIRDGIIVTGGRVIIEGGRYASHPGNSGGYAISLFASELAMKPVPTFDTDFGGGDVRLTTDDDTPSFLWRERESFRSPLRVTRSDAQSLDMVGGVTKGSFDGKTGETVTPVVAVTRNLTGVRNSIGDYIFTFVEPMQTANYSVTGQAADGGTPLFLSAAIGRTTTGFQLHTRTAAGAFADASVLEIVVAE